MHKIAMNAVGDAGQSGTATLTETSTGVTVALHIAGAPAGGLEPAHVHVGSCGTNGVVLVALDAVDGGESTTQLPQKWSGLEGATSIDVHAADLATIFSCGNIQ